MKKHIGHSPQFAFPTCADGGSKGIACRAVYLDGFSWLNGPQAGTLDSVGLAWGFE